MIQIDMKMPKGCVECPFSRYSLSGISCGLIEGKTLFKRDDVINQRSPSGICPLREVKKGKWIVTNQDSEGIHEIKCPFCNCLKGGDFRPRLSVIFTELPLFCDSCGADLRGD